MALDRRAVASRIRELLGPLEPRGLDSVAMRLGVGVFALRAALNEDDPQPSIEVMRAVVTECGVDPTWLLTGRYDADTHRRALEETDELRQILRRLSGETQWRND